MKKKVYRIFYTGYVTFSKAVLAENKTEAVEYANNNLDVPRPGYNAFSIGDEEWDICMGNTEIDSDTEEIVEEEFDEKRHENAIEIPSEWLQKYRNQRIETKLDI